MRITLLILFILSPLYLFSQKTNSGTEFWMGFMKNYDSSYSGKKDSLRLYISSSSNANVTVAIPLQSYASSFVVPKDSVIVFLVPLHLGYISEYEKVVNKAIHITSDFPISLAAMNLLYATTDASIVLPYSNIPRGTTYVAGNPSGSSKNLIMLVAGEDSTKIEIIPNAITYSGLPKYVPYRITLNRGQLYQLSNSSDNLSGSIIKVLSQSKLVVFSGDVCSNWPCGACDHQYEQVLPNDVIDTAYCIPPHFGHTKGYLIKMIPLDTNTDIRVNGFTYRNISRKNPLVIDVKTDSGYYASSTKLFHCLQFLKGASGCNGYINSNYGDPSQLELVSAKYFGESSLFSTVNSFNLKDHFVNLVIKTSAKNNVYLDKSKIDSSEFIPFQYANKYSFAKLKINPGQHLVECSNGLLAYCYGLGFYESYLYLAGFSLPNFDLDFKDSVVSYNCKDKKITLQLNAKTDKKLKKYTWYFGDNTIGYGDPIQHLYNNTGIYTIKLIGEDFNGKKDSITRKINVTWPTFDPVRNKVICGIDTVTFIENNPFFANFKWQDNSTKNYFKEWKNNTIKVIATDTSGFCKFSDSGIVAKLDIFSSIKVDSIEKCWKYNQFTFTDSTKVFADDILHKAWVFPWKTVWDTSKTTIHFPMPGRYKVYFDVYTTQENCKARYPINVVVNPMPKVFAKIKGDLFCANDPVLFYDSSQIVTGHIKKIKLDFDDASSIESDSLKIFKQFGFKPEVIRFYNHIAISDRNCSDTVKNAALIWPKPKVNFTLTNPDTILCLTNARWTYTSTSTIEADTMALYWNAGNGKTSTNYTMKNIRYFNPGKYQVKLKAVSTFGCIDSIVKNIEVVPLPKAKFLINDSAQCFRDHSFKVVDSSFGNHLNYLWTLGNGNTSSISIVDSIKYTGTGIHAIQLKIITPFQGCEDSIVQKIYIFKEPVAHLTINNDTQCLVGNNFSIKNSSLFNNPYHSTKWYSNNFSDTNFNLVSIKLNDTGNHFINLVITDIEGCIDSTIAILNISPQPKISLTIADSIQCFNNNYFVFKSKINMKGETNLWKVNGQFIFTGEIDSLSYTETTAGKHTIQLQKESQNGCKDSTTKNYWLLDAPKADFKLNKDSQCFIGNNYSFTDISVAKNDNIKNWQYLINTTKYNGNPNIQNISFLNVGNQFAQLIIQTKEGCIDSISKTITVLSNPVASIIGDSICLNQIAYISATQISGQPITSWIWDLGDGNDMFTKSGEHLYLDFKTYNLSLNITDAYNCPNTINLNDGVIVYELPDASFYFTESDDGPNQTILRFQPKLNNYNQYFWHFPDGRFNTADTPFLIITELFEGDIQLIVTNQFGCKDSTVQSIKTYPNNFNVYIPTAISINDDAINDVFKIEGIGNAIDYKLKIINRWGEVIFISNDVNAGWNGTYKNEYVQEGVYVYDISFKYYNGKQYQYNGTITVMR